MKHFIFSVFLVLMTIGCKTNNYENQKDINIQGNWFSYGFLTNPMDSLNLKSEINFRYEEVFINSNTIYSFINLVGYISPSSYLIKNDSLYTSFGIENNTDEVTYRRRIMKKSEDNFIYFNDVDTVTYFRLKSNLYILENYIIKDSNQKLKFRDSTNLFSRAFFKRSQEYYYKSKK